MITANLNLGDIQISTPYDNDNKLIHSSNEPGIEKPVVNGIHVIRTIPQHHLDIISWICVKKKKKKKEMVHGLYRFLLHISKLSIFKL